MRLYIEKGWKTMKTQVLDWNEFMNGNIVPLNHQSISVVKVGIGVYALMVPKAVFAAATGDGSFKEILDMLIHIADWLDIGVIMFSGATWMFGQRSKAIELLLGSSIGYLIIRHADEINHWLQGL